MGKSYALHRRHARLACQNRRRLLLLHAPCALGRSGIAVEKAALGTGGGERLVLLGIAASGLGVFAHDDKVTKVGQQLEDVALLERMRLALLELVLVDHRRIQAGGLGDDRAVRVALQRHLRARHALVDDALRGERVAACGGGCHIRAMEADGRRQHRETT